ncbi:Thiol-disulfide oxidoreductase DCC family protein [Balamuthia mandrillaris]
MQQRGSSSRHLAQEAEQEEHGRHHLLASSTDYYSAGAADEGGDLEEDVDEELARYEAVVLFDGVCNFCNSFVNFVIDRDPQNRIKFASLQSETGQNFLDKFHLPNDLSTVVLIQGQQCYTKSSAVLRVLAMLEGSGWSCLYAFIVVPPFLRDFAYSTFASWRYTLFGQSESCRRPTPERC